MRSFSKRPTKSVAATAFPEARAHPSSLGVAENSTAHHPAHHIDQEAKQAKPLEVDKENEDTAPNDLRWDWIRIQNPICLTTRPRNVFSRRLHQ